jgi:phospholipid/cholesterol/gamma-HCH transport system substrate-binding protein
MVKGKGTIGMLLTDSAMGISIKKSVKNLESTTVNANKLTTQFAKFGTKLNTKGGLVDKMLTDTSMFPKLQNSVASLQKTAKSASLLTNNLNAASQKLNSTDNALGVLLNDKQSAEDVKVTVHNLKTSSKKLDDNLEALQHNFLLRGFFKKKAAAEAQSKQK